MQKIEVTKLSDGLGFGVGGISVRERQDVDAVLKSKIEAAIISPDILVTVDADKSGTMLDDDGCGDGRGVHRVLERGKEHSKSLNRPKVFGGGSAMAMAMLIGLGKYQGKTLLDLFAAAITQLQERFASFGAHTDTHAGGASSGCGAIDKAPAVIANAGTFKAEITQTIQALGVDTTGLDKIFEHYQHFAERLNDQDYAGAKVMDRVVQSGKVVKELADDHREMYIVLNATHGYTVNQNLIREMSDGKVQVFAVDMWRLQELVRKLYPIDLTHSEADQEKMHLTQQTAFLSELVYTLAVAATLTKGDLPVYAVNSIPEPVESPLLSTAA